MASLQELVNQIVSDGVMTAEEHETFINAVSADGKIDEAESLEISRIFSLLQEGKLKVVNSPRDEFDAGRPADWRAAYGM